MKFLSLIFGKKTIEDRELRLKSISIPASEKAYQNELMMIKSALNAMKAAISSSNILTSSGEVELFARLDMAVQPFSYIQTKLIYSGEALSLSDKKSLELQTNKKYSKEFISFFKSEALKNINCPKDWLEAIIAKHYRHTYNSLHANLEKDRQLSFGISQYKWSTAGDERVCQLCSANNGKTFTWLQPTKIGYPGQCNQCDNGYCRCVALAVFK